MKVEEALELAAKCGLPVNQVVTITPEAVELFARLVNARAFGEGWRAGVKYENEMCAGIVDRANRTVDQTCMDCAISIRARGGA